LADLADPFDYSNNAPADDPSKKQLIEHGDNVKVAIPSQYALHRRTPDTT
jgi:hypothetical protein